ncbi:MAG: A24 family peptidase, partial [Phycisphaerae bacterium]
AESAPPGPGLRFGAACAAGLAVWLVTVWRLDRYRAPSDEACSGESTSLDSEAPAAPGDQAEVSNEPSPASESVESASDASDERCASAESRSRFHPAPIVLLAGVFLGLIVATIQGSAAGAVGGAFQFAVRSSVVLSLLSFVLILVTMQPRAVDAQMVEMIEEERPQARAMVLKEFLTLLPAIGAGVLAYLLLEHVAERGSGASVTVLGGLLNGASAAAAGVATAMALGWGIRIFFTLVFGKEAYGEGDIHIMAAIGAVGGFWMCLVAFFAAGVLALFGVVASLFRKSVRALPFGPWLALGTLVALWVQEPLYDYMMPGLGMLWRTMAGQAITGVH